MTYGMRSTLALAYQGSGTATNVASLYHLQAIKESFAPDLPPLMEQGMRGRLDENPYYFGPRATPGEIEMEAHPINLGVLVGAICARSVLSTSGSLYTHQFLPRAADWHARWAGQPCTVLRYLDTGSADRFTDLVANELELSVSAGEFLKVKVGFVGGAHDQIAAVAASYPSGKLYTWEQGSCALDGSAIVLFPELSIKQTEKIDAGHTLSGSSNPSRAKRTGYREVRISGKAKFDDQTQYQRFLAGSEGLLQITFRGPTVVQSGFYDEFKIFVPAFRLTEYKPMAGGPGEIEVGFQGVGAYDATSAQAIWYTLQNTQAAYG